MAIVFFIITFFLLLSILFVISTIQIRVQRLTISNEEKEKLQYDYQIFLELILFHKVKMISLEIDKKKIEILDKKINLEQKLKKIDLKKIKKDLPSKQEMKKISEKINVKLERFHLLLDLGTIDVIITSAIITIISSALGIVLSKLIKHYQKEKYEYKIVPIYQNKNVINLSLNCIIQVKMVHIISIIYMLRKFRKEKKRYERTSNRRSYDYSYEQY